MRARRPTYRRVFAAWLVAALVLACQLHPASAEEETASTGLVPVPDYSGDLGTRPRLTGDWGGKRQEWAEKGVQLDFQWTQIVQSVVEGGVEEESAYGGSFDYTLHLDLMRMGVLPGALVTLRAESRYGESVNDDSGSILPVNTDAFFPMSSTLDDDVGITITTLSWTQFLSGSFGVMLGKFDTLDGDPNEFASGRGTSQFMAANFLFNVALALRFPYSTLGGGLIWIPVHPGPRGGILVNTLLIQTTDSSETTGFGYFDDGLSSVTEADFQWRLGDLPGGGNVGFLYSFDQDFTKLGSRFLFPPGQGGLEIPTEDDTWTVYTSAWQYLLVRDPSDAPIDVRDGMADRQGLGLFLRVGTADQDTSPVEWSVSGGLGGRGVFRRTNDTYGVGYYYSHGQSGRITGVLGIDDEAHGGEAYYSIGITPAAHLTFNMQVVESVLPNPDTALILGGRLNLAF